MALLRIDAIAGRSPDGSLEIFDYQTSNEAHDIVLGRLNGEHDGGTNQRSTFTYAVKSGSVTIVVDESVFEASSGDVITVKPGSSKVLKGEAELFIICSPPFDPADEI